MVLHSMLNRIDDNINRKRCQVFIKLENVCTCCALCGMIEQPTYQQNLRKLGAKHTLQYQHFGRLGNGFNSEFADLGGN